MTRDSADIIDLLAGLTPASALTAVRDQRAQARENAQRSFEALLEPDEAGTFSFAERYAVAAFVAGLHGVAPATEFYRDLLADESAALAAAIAEVHGAAAATGPFGRYREPGLHSEDREGLRWHPSATAAAALGTRLTAALEHTHLLVFRPREARPDDLAALVDAGWSADDIVTLSQLVAFLTFQLRLAHGLRVLAAYPADSAEPADPAGLAGVTPLVAEGA